MSITAVAEEMNYHRNTVCYNLDIIRRETGKDITQFNDLACLLRDLGEMPGEPQAVRGRWIQRIFFGQKAWACSECGAMGSPYWKRCPVCEAKMEVKDETD